MFPAMTDSDRRHLRELVGSSLEEAVREAARIEDPAELELLASDLVPPLALAGLPEVAAELVDMVAECKGGLGLLHAMAAAAPPPVSRLAAEAAACRGGGPLRLAASRVGTLVPERAWELDVGEPVMSVIVACRRPGAGEYQALGFTIERSATGGALKDSFVTHGLGADELEPWLLGPARAVGLEPREIPAGEAVALVAAGAARCAEIGLGPDSDALLAITLLLRGGGREDADSLLEPLVGLPSLAEALDEAEGDLEETAAVTDIDAFIDALDAWCAGRGLEQRRRELVVYAGGVMADFLAYYVDGHVAGWGARELEEFLLDFVPRKVSLEDNEIEPFPEAVAETLRFLGATGRLNGKRADALVQKATRLAPAFARAARDPRNFGLAKGMAAAMAADGVDLTDEGAVQEWLVRFNDLPRQDREQRMPALTWFLAPGSAASSSKSAKRRGPAKAKKAQRQARRRSRSR